MNTSPQTTELVQSLLQPDSYPEKPSHIELVQTQMSFVFLVDEMVYKVKKAVDLGYLDYTTLENRRRFSLKEVELNRRLSPDIYLGIVPITREDSRFVVDGKGEAVEYAVKMRRLPQDRMMSVLLDGDQVSGEMAERVARRLVDFHDNAETGPSIDAYASIDAIRRNIDENFGQTDRYFGRTISEGQYERIRAYTYGFIDGNTPLFRQRVKSGRIRDCHGDLHAEHICFTNGIYIFDCIEFNDRFRYCDVASEIAFLAMDIDRHGRAELSRSFVRSYVDGSGDVDLLHLLNFYKCYRAYVRGKVNSFALDAPDIDDDGKAQAVRAARSYFDLAFAYTRTRPVLLITTGLVGTGKTTLAQALAKRSGLAMISSDVLRKQLAGIPEMEHRYEEFSSGIYSDEFSRRTYDTMFDRARDILSSGNSVILDASFIKRGERQRAKRLAEDTGAHFLIVECRLDADRIKRRLARRAKAGAVSDGRWEIYRPQRRSLEPVLSDEASHLAVDASQPVDVIAGQVLDRLLSF